MHALDLEEVVQMRSFWLLQIAAILLVPPAWYAWRHRDDAQRALKGAALVLGGMYAGFVGTFVIGDTLSDPGGWVAVGWTAAWTVPLLALSLLAWRRSPWTVPVLVGLLLALVGVYAWSVVAPQPWSTFQDTHGPILAMIGFVLAVPMGVLGWWRPRIAGPLLLALTTLSMALLLIGTASGGGGGGWSTAIVLTAPTGIIGTLLLIAGSRHPTPPSRMGSSASHAWGLGARPGSRSSGDR